jgi:hypothetical protein
MAGPDIFIEGLAYRSSTFPLQSPGDDLPRIDEDDKTPLARLLRRHKIEDPGFWSFQLLLHILSRGRILAELRKYTQLENAEKYVEHIRPENELVSESPAFETKTYLRIFALLVLTKKGCEIGNFVKEEVSDEKLPVCRHEGSPREQFNLCSKKEPDQPLKAFEEWEPHEREWFEHSQWETLVPYFDLDPGNKARHYSLDDRAILPWRKKNSRSLIFPQSGLSSRSSRHEGGFADVSCIRIDSSSHGFSDILKDVSQSFLLPSR